MKSPLLLSAAVSTLLTAQSSAVIIFSSTVDSRLISFDSAAPGTLLSDVPISGLAGVTESVQGIDFRQGTGQLFAIGNAPGGIYRLYTLNTTTGAATRVGSTDFNFAGNAVGFDFNPTVDRIRLVTDAQVSARLNPITGALAALDTNLATGGITAVAYDRHDIDPGTLTTLFGINVTTDQLVRIGGVDGTPSPNGGEVTTIGPLGVNTSFASFDIYTANTAFAALTTSGVSIPAGFYTLNLGTGAATLVGTIGNGTIGVTGLAAVPEPGSLALLGLAGAALIARHRRDRSAGR